METLTNAQLAEYVASPYAWPGGYEIAFLTADGATLCWHCVDDIDNPTHTADVDNCDDGWLVVGVITEDWLNDGCAEGQYTLCDHCGHGIGDDNAPTRRERLQDIDTRRPLTDGEALAYLRLDNGSIPCSRYARRGFDAAPIAVAMSDILTRESDGEGHTIDKLDHAMGLVVNDHEDIAYMIGNYGTDDERGLIGDALDDSAREAGRSHYATTGYRENPLSGEWAGESIGEIGDAYGVNLYDNDSANAFCEGFTEAFDDDDSVTDLDRAVIAYREDPTDERRADVLEAQRDHVTDAATREINELLGER